jgi:undecaprenyl-diphosphatase
VLTLQAFVLGLVQGLTEFLPVSSSGHLQLVPYVLGWPSADLAFDAVVHAGTLLAVLVAFRGDLIALARGVLARPGTTPAEVATARRMTLLLAVATLPAAIAGATLESTFAAAFDSPRLVAGALYVTALLLWGSERLRRRRGGDPGADEGLAWREVGMRQGLAVGAAQALAILPGISRSGATIATGMMMGLLRRAAARFSFLLSIPIILGSTIVMLPRLSEPTPGALAFGPWHVAVGVTAAALSGYAAIRGLLRLVERRDLGPFAIYVTIVATAVLVLTVVRG